MNIISAEAIARVSSVPTLPATWLTKPDELELLANYQALTEQAGRFIEAGFAARDVFASRYYWFQLLVNLSEKRYGRDAGMHQQASEILEHPHPDCDPDWKDIEAIHELIDGET